jgi:hypothetical protein
MSSKKFSYYLIKNVKKTLNAYTNKKFNSKLKNFNKNVKRGIINKSYKNELKTLKKSNKRKINISKTRPKIPIIGGLNFDDLIHICPDSGECIALGNQKDALINFFGGFTNFENVEYPIVRVGVASQNGTVYKLKYTINDYSSYALLKCPQSKKSDNLVYEYEVGLFINKQCRRFSCFLETYGLYFFKDVEAYSRLYYPNTKLETILEQHHSIDYKKACDESNLAAILIEHVSNSITLKTLYKNNKTNDDFINYDLPQILFQVYFTLAQLAREKSFTHYDLHDSNVLVYILPENKYVNFEYTSDIHPNVSFQSRYIAKIIDYGKCYYKDDNFNSLITFEKICEEPSCEPDCGMKYGFIHLNETKRDETHDGSTVSIYFNRSSDLKLLYLFRNVISIQKLGTLFYDPSRPISNFDQYKKWDKILYRNNFIDTVVDAAIALVHYINNINREILIEKCIGILQIDNINPIIYTSLIL